MVYVFTDGEQLTAQKVNEYLVNRPFDYRAEAQVAIPSGSGGVNVNVTFATPFPAGVTPVVNLSVSHPNITHWRVTGRSETGFTARFDRSGSASYTFDYMALREN